MSIKELKFEGYQGMITEMDFESGMIHGEVLLTKDVVTFKAKNIKDLAEEFKASVADYLEFCREDGVTPNKPLKGELLVRCGEDIQAQIITLIASKKLAGEKVSQNEWCKDALRAQLDREKHA
jgi:predicted HicB family RNase H-like nuclease